MMSRAVLGTALAALLLASGSPAISRGTQAGVYTAAQAEAGSRVYAIKCAMCHGAQLEGTVEVPGLVGKFVANWGGRPLGNLFDYLGRAMPQTAPGTLTPQENAELIAFILRENGAPAGNRVLPSESAALQRIDFDAIALPQTPAR